MNIPLAYDLLPPTTAAPFLSTTIDDELRREMYERGIGHIDIKQFRQTPKQALLSPYGMINMILSACINFGLNVGIGYAILKDNDEVGLFIEPSTPDAYKSAVFTDLLATAFVIALLSGIIATPGIRKALKQLKTLPIENWSLERGYWRYWPVRQIGMYSRSFYIAVEIMVVFGGLTILGLYALCGMGALHADGQQCSMNAHSYIFIKATWTFFLTFAIYPLILVGTLNKKTLPALDYHMWVEQLRLKEEPQPM